jgi:hypothetical protein
MKEVIDHLGNKYKTLGGMCHRYGIEANTFMARINKGWCLEKALTTPLERGGVVEDHQGQVFDNLKVMCEHWGVRYDTFLNRKKAKLPLELCLYHGYLSRAAMERAWGLRSGTLQRRLDNNCSIKESLLSGVKKNG